MLEPGFHGFDGDVQDVRSHRQGEDYPPFEHGLPKYVTLKNAPVARKLAAFEV